jgi:hypothetical protein
VTSRAIGCVLWASLAACGDGGDPRSDDAGPIDAPPAIDAPAQRDAPTPSDAPPADTAALDAPVAGATLVGSVSRSTTDTVPVDPPPDGLGDLYLSVFETNPASGPPGPAVASQAIPGVDLSAPTLSVPFRLEGIPPRTEPYYVTAFLDDTGPADPSHPCPNAGDSVATEGFGVPTVVIDTEAEHTLDLDLDSVLIFTPAC